MVRLKRFALVVSVFAFSAAACSPSTRPQSREGVTNTPAPVARGAPANTLFVGDAAIGRAFVDAMRARNVDADATTVESDLEARVRGRNVVAHGAAAGAVAALALTRPVMASLLLLDGKLPDVSPRAPLAVRCAVLSSRTASNEPARAARRFAVATGAARHHVAERDEHTLVAFSTGRDDVADFVAAFVSGKPAPGGADSGWSVRDTWNLHTPFSTEPFWRDAKLVVRRTADDPFKNDVKRVFAGMIGELDPYPGATYDAIDLDAYLAAHPELGTGHWLVIENVRGERLVLDRKTLATTKPVIVVGLDDERNLFRLLVTYNVYRTHSWKPEPGPRPLLARPLGAFLHVPGRENGLGIETFARYALTPQSFRVVGSDPLAMSRKHEQRAGLEATLTGAQGCLQCHALLGEGARAHHVRARDGAPVGGDALPLEQYPSGVLERFLFRQEEVAESFGVSPLRVAPAVATKLLAIAQKR